MDPTKAEVVETQPDEQVVAADEAPSISDHEPLVEKDEAPHSPEKEEEKEPANQESFHEVHSEPGQDDAASDKKREVADDDV